MDFRNTKRKIYDIVIFGRDACMSVGTDVTQNERKKGGIMDTKDMEKKHESCCGGHHHDHEGGCCGHHHGGGEEEVITLNLELDNGESVECEVVGTFEVDEKEYIALLPENDDRVLLYIYQEEGDDLILENIEDEEEFERVSDTFWEIFGDEEDDEETE